MLRRHDGGRVHLQDDRGAGDLLSGRQQVAAIEGCRIVRELAVDPEGAGAVAHLGRLERLRGPGGGPGDPGGTRRTDQAQIDDLDAAVGEVMSVLALVHLVKGLEGRVEGGRIDRAAGEGDPQLVTLADIAQVAAPLERDLGEIDAVGREARLEFLLHGREVGVDARQVGGPRDLERGPDGVVAQVGDQQPDRRGDAGMRRHDDLRHAQHVGHFRAMQRARAAERHQRIVARVDALLDGARADGIGHVGVDHGDHAFGRLAVAHLQLARQLADHPARRHLVERHPAAQEVLRIEPAQHDIGVGHGGPGAAAAVGGRAGHGAGRARADLEGAGLVEMGDRAAAGTDRVHVDHRHHHGKARDPGVARGGFSEAAFGHDADVGRGAADIEGDEVALARQRTRPVAADHARRRAREQGEDGALGDHGGRGDAAVGRHDAQVGPEAAGLDVGFELGDVVAHLGADEGVHRRRGEALELAELRRHRRGGRGEALWIFLAHDRQRAILMRGIEVGEQEADGDCLHALFLELAHGLANARFVERFEFLAPGRHQPLLHGLAEAPLDQRAVLPGNVLHDRVVLRPLVPADMQDVAVAAGGDQAGDRAVMLEDGVGRDGGAMEHHVDRLARNSVLVAEGGKAGDDAARGIVGRGRDLVHAGLAGLGVGKDQVGEGAAHIDADHPHARLPISLFSSPFIWGGVAVVRDGGVKGRNLRSAVRRLLTPPSA